MNSFLVCQSEPFSVTKHFSIAPLLSCCVSDNAMDNAISPEAPRPNPALRKPWLGSGSPGGPSSPPKQSAVSPVHVESLVGNGKERHKSGHPVKKRTVLGHPPFPTSTRTWPTTKSPLPPISHNSITCSRPMFYFTGLSSSSIKVPPVVSDDLELLFASTNCQMKSSHFSLFLADLRLLSTGC